MLVVVIHFFPLFFNDTFTLNYFLLVGGWQITIIIDEFACFLACSFLFSRTVWFNSVAESHTCYINKLISSHMCSVAKMRLEAIILNCTDTMEDFCCWRKFY
ncbi:hypothetical protein H1C71_026850 [Ictidomys tridecemlineatus]|nr:hypothetical protein H1C71_026850 [Ictidomys tridecemlineatus]KAG3290446.1 hypothetical protein H1C71_026850 [Ictidomys tridecemlineatus]KAG3290447.1 hypothetical protein H1C71_026850 [Ictidomys tridecemlineatus]KAG3290448.1 hypothetical protein H1C71_026850 [Ictidomys tridecemlineatus]KAG3290449.1 hypothetical protein H1C71_026850 [Ictidomys tridecemlineatus]